MQRSAIEMDKHKHDEDAAGHPGDYGSRTLADEEPQRTERADVGRTADGDPLVERGTAGNDRPPET